MKKRLIALALAIVCVTCLLTSCGRGSSEEGGVTIPLNMKLISPDTAEYYLFVPEEWKTDLSTGVVTAYYSDSDPSNISMMAFGLGGSEMSYTEYWDSYSAQFETVYSDYQLEDSSEILLDGITAGRFIYSGRFGATSDSSADAEVGNLYKFSTIVVMKYGSIYILTYSALDSMYDLHIDDFGKIIDNFKFKN